MISTHQQRILISIAATAACIFAANGNAQTFTDVTLQAGLDYLQYDPRTVEQGIQNQLMTGGAAAGDVDRDGWVDLFVTRLDQPGILFRNLGTGAGGHLGFQDVTAQAFPSPPIIRSNGAAFGDIDNDGDPDLYVTATKDSRYYLYVNDGNGAFTEEALPRGAAVDKPDIHFGNGIAFGDYNADGFLDVYTAEWRHEPCTTNPTFAPSNTRLLRNRGTQAPGYFEDVTEAAGVAIDHVAELFHGRTYEGAAFGFAPRFSDLDGDGRVDLLLTSDFRTSRLFWNNGDGTFTDGTSAAGLGTDQNGMGSTVGDFNGDGRLDWFVTAIDTVEGNRLYRNDGNRTFTDRASPAGVQRAGWGWGTSFLDYDNDGDQDIVMTNGFNLSRVPDDRTTLFRNDSGQFTDVSALEGITDIGQGRGLLTLDYNNDGNLDIFLVNNGGHPILYRNNGGANNWLRLVTSGTRSNSDGIGARITVIPDRNDPASLMVREIDGGSNYLANNELTAHFGLGPSTDPIDLVEIHWPSGVVQQLADVMPNQTIVITEPDRPPTPEELSWMAPVVPGAAPVPDIAPPADEATVAPAPTLPGGGMTVVYDPTSGRVVFEGPDEHRYMDITLQITPTEKTHAGFQFNTGVANWRKQDVFSFVDEPLKQGFVSHEKCQGTYVMRGGGAIDNLLPAGLSQRQLEEHLTVDYTLMGIPGTHRAQLVVVPEPAGLCLALLGLVGVAAAGWLGLSLRSPSGSAGSHPTLSCLASSSKSSHSATPLGLRRLSPSHPTRMAEKTHSLGA
jgi:hypothetical protein